MTQQRMVPNRSRAHGNEYVRMDLYDRDREETGQDMQEIKAGVADIRKRLDDIVPRSEHARIWAENDAHFARVEARITDLETALRNATQRVDNRFLANSNQSTYLLFTLIIGVICAYIGHLVH